MERVTEFAAAFRVALKNLSADNASVAAAGVGFFGFLSMVPAMVAALSIYGLWLNPAELEQQIADVTNSMPSDAASLVTRQLKAVATTDGLGPIAVVTILLALWSASGALKNLMVTLNTAYGRTEQRGFLKLRGTALGLTVGAIVAMVTATALITALPSLLDQTPLSDGITDVLQALRWPLLGVGMIVGLSILYRFGPDRTGEPFELVTPGAVTAMVVWVGVAYGFSFYADNFSKYSQTFGAMAGLVMLLMWLYLTSLVVLLGAELNAALAGRPAIVKRVSKRSSAEAEATDARATDAGDASGRNGANSSDLGDATETGDDGTHESSLDLAVEVPMADADPTMTTNAPPTADG